MLGGTTEARALAARLHGLPGFDVTSSLAGRVAAPVLPAGETRVGPFGGVEGLVGWLRLHGTDVVVDATHPFAGQITRHAVAATAALRVPLLVLRRPGWTAQPGDRWHRVPTAAAAAALLPALGRRVFLATGRGDLTAFAAVDGHWFLLRAVDPPGPPLPRHHHLVLDRGPFTVDGERSLLREHRVDVVVSRDSGGAATAAKLAAARDLALPVVLLDRPAPPDAPVVATVEEAVRRLADLRDRPGPAQPTGPQPAGP